MTALYAHLGVYSDWAAAAPGPRARATRPAPEVVRSLASVILAAPGRGLHPGAGAQDPGGVRVERHWSASGLKGEESPTPSATAHAPERG
jgi:hypothetical protein